MGPHAYDCFLSHCLQHQLVNLNVYLPCVAAGALPAHISRTKSDVRDLRAALSCDTRADEAHQQQNASTKPLRGVAPSTAR